MWNYPNTLPSLSISYFCCCIMCYTKFPFHFFLVLSFFIPKKAHIPYNAMIIPLFSSLHFCSFSYFVCYWRVFLRKHHKQPTVSSFALSTSLSSPFSSFCSCYQRRKSFSTFHIQSLPIFSPFLILVHPSSFFFLLFFFPLNSFLSHVSTPPLLTFLLTFLIQ